MRSRQGTSTKLTIMNDDMSNELRIAFFGTPEFAVPTLEAVAREHDVVLVVAQPEPGVAGLLPPVASTEA